MKDDTKFCFQHHARWLEQGDGFEVISLYDNSAHGTEYDDGSEILGLILAIKSAPKYIRLS
jgi:hypothetical protein